MFSCLKFIKPLWYFNLSIGENLIWPDPNKIVPPELLDKNYNSYESMISEASYLALMSGYIPSDLEKDQLSSSFINYNHTVYDEFYFLKKFFNPIWSVAFLIYRLITFGYFYSAISAFLKLYMSKELIQNMVSYFRKNKT